MASKSKSKKALRSIESLTRRNSIRQREGNIYIVCEGQTEEWYFNYLKAHPSIDLDKVVVVEVRGGAPIGVVRRACEIKKKLEDDKISVSNDMIWAVFDTERLADNTSFFKAVDMARGNGIECAISCPCIEYWLLLHHENTDAAFYKCAEVEKIVKTKVPGYEKGKDASTHFPLEKVKEAVKRAKKFYDGMPDANKYETTSSDVYRLVARLFEMAGVEV